MSTLREVALRAHLAAVPFVQELGPALIINGETMHMHLPVKEELVGNSALGSLHGSVLSALLEITAMSQIFLSTGIMHLPKPMSVTYDFVRNARKEVEKGKNTGQARKLFRALREWIDDAEQ